LNTILKIIVVDDHEFFRKGLVFVLNRLKYVELIAEASNGREFLDILEKNVPDIVLMDISMPNLNGIEASKLALAKYPDLKIILLSSHQDEQFLEAGIEAGIKGFLLKNIDKDILDHALQVVAQDKPFFSDEFLPYFTQQYISTKNPSNTIQLSKREMEILHLIGAGFTNQEIADKLFISLRTVTNHRASMYQKTKTNNTAGLLAISIKNHWITL
jgi:DNA-binding NarL/FixJ family response regulator